MRPPTHLIHTLIAVNELDAASELTAKGLRVETSYKNLGHLNEFMGTICSTKGDYS